MSLPHLYPYQQQALTVALMYPRHFLFGKTGYGSRAVQAHLARKWGAVVIAPKILHPVWRKYGIEKVYSPQYVDRHPELEARELVVDVLSGKHKSVFTLVKLAKQVSIRRLSDWNNTVFAVPIVRRKRTKGPR